MLAIKLAASARRYAFEHRPCLTWRGAFNLFSYSFTPCFLPASPFSRFIFIAIYYSLGGEGKEKNERVGKEKKRGIESKGTKEGGFYTASQVLCSAEFEMTRDV